MSNKQRKFDLKTTRKALQRSLVRLRAKGYHEMCAAEEFLLGEVTRDLKTLEARENPHSDRPKRGKRK